MEMDFFKDIFSTKIHGPPDISSFTPNYYLSERDCLSLSRIPNSDEIKECLFRMNPLNCPGLDGIQPKFFQHFWEHLHSEISDFVIHCFNTSKIPECINKSYMEKYSLEWSFIRDTLTGFGFPLALTNLIMDCICSPSISVLWNAEITDSFKPSRGIRQGDPMSSYIFVLCLERAFLNNVTVMMDVVKDFGRISGLNVNESKSSMIFPTKMCHVVRRSVAAPFNLSCSSGFGKYLGINILPNKLKSSNYLSLLDKTINRIKGWQAKLLNLAGRSTLIKSVLDSYLVYHMQTNLLPISILNNLEKSCRKFLWNKVDHVHYSPRIGRAHVTKPMEIGGLGIRRLRDWNLAFMSKLGWTMLNNPNKLWVRIFNKKYLKSSAFLDHIPNNSQSQIWRDILKGRELLANGMKIGIGNGTKRIMRGRWKLLQLLLVGIVLPGILPPKGYAKVTTDGTWVAINDAASGGYVRGRMVHG
ncbi:uncharacterized protein LOC110720190 [Chenopodium quinoa]|uniref:uncharacterized protein LOC110720190 n=1 Tax=Chenopodium quinoa TaxID=63459 RepID=UPI000B78738E|nr:uncharacterized protein LOC110720190 [Chenopodium quinoa]